MTSKNGNGHTQTAAETAKPSRMTLAAIKRGKVKKPYRVLLYSPEGTGKTTFASNAPAPIFIAPEDGTARVDIARFPTPETWADVMEAISALHGEHEYKTLVVDTVDWLEPLVWRNVCEASGVRSIEDVGGGYGKGYVAAIDVWRQFLAAIERLQAARGMHVLLLAHSTIRTFRNPDGEDWDRYQTKLQEKAGGLMREWCDEVLFACLQVFANKDAKTKRVKGVSNGARIIYTDRTAAYDAKNRHSLPEELPLSWPDFAAAMEAEQTAKPEDLTSEIQRKAKQLGGDLEKSTIDSLGRVTGDAAKLAILNNWVNSKLTEREA